MTVKGRNFLKCPKCGYDGGFKQASPRFFVFDIWHWLVERNIARRSFVCPKCGTKVTVSAGLWFPYVVMVLIVVAGVIGALLVSILQA
jgi:DNA-directed RNA polymerase subunit RPC12/RpoP